MATRPNPRVRERRAQRRQQSNPPFDKRITALAPAGGRPVNLKRGKLTSMDQTASVGWTLRFLYNPSTIEVAHSVDMELLSDAERSPFDVSTYAGDSLSQINWSLLFDRTYETWDRAYRNKDAGKYGVYADIRALYGLLGMVKQKPINGLDLITGPMTVRPAQVYFGGDKSLSYYGRIESATVQYTHWTTKMIPNRAVVGLSMKIFPKNPFIPGGSVGSSDSAAGGKSPSKKKRVAPRSARAAEGLLSPRREIIGERY